MGHLLAVASLLGALQLSLTQDECAYPACVSKGVPHVHLFERALVYLHFTELPDTLPARCPRIEATYENCSSLYLPCERKVHKGFAQRYQDGAFVHYLMRLGRYLCSNLPVYMDLKRCFTEELETALQRCITGQQFDIPCLSRQFNATSNCSDYSRDVFNHHIRLSLPLFPYLIKQDVKFGNKCAYPACVFNQVPNTRLFERAFVYLHFTALPKTFSAQCPYIEATAENCSSMYLPCASDVHKEFAQRYQDGTFVYYLISLGRYVCGNLPAYMDLKSCFTGRLERALQSCITGQQFDIPCLRRQFNATGNCTDYNRVVFNHHISNWLPRFPYNIGGIVQNVSFGNECAYPACVSKGVPQVHLFERALVYLHFTELPDTLPAWCPRIEATDENCSSLYLPCASDVHKEFAQRYQDGAFVHYLISLGRYVCGSLPAYMDLKSCFTGRLERALQSCITGQRFDIPCLSRQFNATGNCTDYNRVVFNHHISNWLPRFPYNTGVIVQNVSFGNECAYPACVSKGVPQVHLFERALVYLHFTELPDTLPARCPRIEATDENCSSLYLPCASDVHKEFAQRYQDGAFVHYLISLGRYVCGSLPAYMDLKSCFTGGLERALQSCITGQRFDIPCLSRQFNATGNCTDYNKVVFNHHISNWLPRFPYNTGVIVQNVSFGNECAYPACVSKGVPHVHLFERALVYLHFTELPDTLPARCPRIEATDENCSSLYLPCARKVHKGFAQRYQDGAFVHYLMRLGRYLCSNLPVYMDLKRCFTKELERALQRCFTGQRFDIPCLSRQYNATSNCSDYSRDVFNHHIRLSLPLFPYNTDM